MLLYETIGIFRDFLAYYMAKYQYFSMIPRLFVKYYKSLHSLFKLNVSLNVDFIAKKKPKKCTTSAISQFATFTQLQSPKKFHILHLSIFSLEILNMTSKLNLAVNYLLRFLNFDFGAFLAQFS